MSQPDTYKYAPLEPDHIRLLRVLPESTADDIQCQITHRKLNGEDIVRYAALSYCWGDPTPVATITIDGHPLSVARNLHDFLQNRFLHEKGMFQHKSEAIKDTDLWIDAICINQGDNEEKSTQVQDMWKIYTYAAIVIGWLGKEKEYTKRAFFALNTRFVSRMARSPPPPSFEKMIEDAKPDIVALTQDPYFSRMWIVQEVTCAEVPKPKSKLMLHSGRHVTYFQALYEFSALSKGAICTQGNSQVIAKDGLSLGVESLFYIIKRQHDSLKDALRTYDRTDMTHTLVTTITDHKQKQCYDIRDKIFALRGLPCVRVLEAGVPHVLKVDYNMSINETAVAAISYIDALDHMCGEDYREYAPFVISSLFGITSELPEDQRVDVTSDDFRSWLESKLVQDSERGTLELVTDSGTRINCDTPFFQRIINNDFSPLTKMLNGHIAEFMAATDGSEGEGDLATASSATEI